MKNAINLFKDRIYYALACMKNRYPCKILKISNYEDGDEAIITYQSGTRFNIRTGALRQILNDPSLVEKFHPTDGVRLGFLSSGQILFEGNQSMIKTKQRFNDIAAALFERSSFDEYRKK